jgi:hypothetical protein
MLQTKVVDQIKIHILYATKFFENLAVYGIMWKNNVEWGGAQIKIWLTHIASWKPEATNTHSEMQYLLLFHSNSG